MILSWGFARFCQQRHFGTRSVERDPLISTTVRFAYNDRPPAAGRVQQDEANGLRGLGQIVREIADGPPSREQCAAIGGGVRPLESPKLIRKRIDGLEPVGARLALPTRDDVAERWRRALAQWRAIQKLPQQPCQQCRSRQAMLAPCCSQQLTVRQKDNLGGVTETRGVVFGQRAQTPYNCHSFGGLNGHPIRKQLGDRNSSSSFHAEDRCEIEAIIAGSQGGRRARRYGSACRSNSDGRRVWRRRSRWLKNARILPASARSKKAASLASSAVRIVR